MDTTELYPIYWQFARQRMDIFTHRFQGQPLPWTDDPILQQYRFTNVFRASDRVSQYLIRNVLYKPQDVDESGNVYYGLNDTVFRTLLFKLFNLPETWEYLQQKVGEIVWQSGCLEDYRKIILELREGNKPHYNNAYMMQGRKMEQYGFGSGYKFENHLAALDWMMEHGLPQNLQACKTMEEMYLALLSQPYMGKFLAYQFTIDLNYSHWFNFDENDFVMAGPGAERGLKKIFKDVKPTSKDGATNYTEAIQWLVDHQVEEQVKLGLEPVTLFGRQLHLIDAQNLLCETDKYTRASHPEANHFGQKRIKQQYRQPDTRLIVYFFPPKWGLNEKLYPHTEAQVASAA